MIKYKKEKTCILIDLAIPGDRKVTQKEAEKKTKIQEFMYMWNVYLKCMIIPVIIGLTGLVKKGFKKNLEAIPGKHSIDSLEKTAILGTSHTIWKVMQSET